MISTAQPMPPSVTRYPTTWGLTPRALHDSYWAARGVHVVRCGSSRPVPHGVEQYMLLDSDVLLLFRMHPLVDLLSWVEPKVLFLRVRNLRERNYRELAVMDRHGRFSHFKREYSSVGQFTARVALTRDRALAEQWRIAPSVQVARRQLRRSLRSARREAATITARVFHGSQPDDVARFMRCLVDVWPHPASVLSDVTRVASGAWAHREFKLDPTVRFVGNVWVGAGRSLPPGQTVLGPAILWDDPAYVAASKSVPLEDVEPMPPARHAPRAPITANPCRSVKRMFDIVFSLVALLLTAPIYPIVMLAIWIEDGRPFFFAHRRETLGGRHFPCIKFRSMRHDAEKIKTVLAQANQADGPQFFIDNDPRLTRVGRIIRGLNVDELPQFINVLLGHMSVVGPRPSPTSENQCCPAWREARLSVRPGVTGLWQVMRTRRKGLDFQEWIKYDLEYVEHASCRLDLWIIFRTILVCLGRGR